MTRSSLKQAPHLSLRGSAAVLIISLKGRIVFEDVELVKSRKRLKTTSDILKVVILKINVDILQKKNKKTIKTLEDIAAACR